MLGLVELLVVLFAVMGWGVYELMSLRRDRAAITKEQSPAPPTDSPS